VKFLNDLFYFCLSIFEVSCLLHQSRCLSFQDYKLSTRISCRFLRGCFSNHPRYEVTKSRVCDGCCRVAINGSGHASHFVDIRFNGGNDSIALFVYGYHYLGSSALDATYTTIKHIKRNRVQIIREIEIPGVAISIGTKVVFSA